MNEREMKKNEGAKDPTVEDQKKQWYHKGDASLRIGKKA